MLLLGTRHIRYWIGFASGTLLYPEPSVRPSSTHPVFWYFLSLQQETLKAEYLPSGVAMFTQNLWLCQLSVTEKPANTTMKINAMAEKAFISNDTSFIRYKAIAKHSSTCRAILVFFLIIKYTHLLCIFQLKSNFCEKHDNLSKHGFKNTAAFSVQLLKSKGNLPSIP